MGFGCAFGPCENAKSRGGPGCDLCDRVAKLPQPPSKWMADDPQAKFETPAEVAKRPSRDPITTKRKRKAIAKSPDMFKRS